MKRINYYKSSSFTTKQLLISLMKQYIQYHNDSCDGAYLMIHHQDHELDFGEEVCCETCVNIRIPVLSNTTMYLLQGSYGKVF